MTEAARHGRGCRLIFETHATSVDNEAGLASGWADVPLSRPGEAQARALGERRRAAGIAAVYCSDLERAWRTAAIAFGATDLPIRRDARLRECDYGARTRHPAAEIERARIAHVTTPFPGGESYADVVVRVAGWLGDLPAAVPDLDQPIVLVIGHRATYFALEHLLRGRALAEVIAAPWQWQPGWTYDLAM
jgi:2,3-bisphosphoglycerate-dependent phosphoglycerate mutase